MKIYIAGALFNEAEIHQRKKEEIILKNEFKDKINIFNPINQPFNKNKEGIPSPKEIFSNDTEAIKNCDIFLADITNEDSGVMIELGIAISLGKKIIAVNSDIRLKSANKYDIPSYSINHYLLGAILANGVLVFNFREAVEKLKKICI